MQSNNIPIYTSKDFEGMRKAGSLAAKILDQLKSFINPGISTLEINDFCHELIIKNEAIPAPLNYKGFPKSICTSVNHVVCHGIPSDKVLKEGDILNVDVTAYKDGWHGDTSRMFEIGEVSIKAKKLIKITYDSMMKAIKILKENIQLGDIGSTIQQHVEAKGCSVVQDFCGHGIGQRFIFCNSCPTIV